MSPLTGATLSDTRLPLSTQAMRTVIGFYHQATGVRRTSSLFPAVVISFARMGATQGHQILSNIPFGGGIGGSSVTTMPQQQLRRFTQPGHGSTRSAASNHGQRDATGVGTGQLRLDSCRNAALQASLYGLRFAVSSAKN